MIYPLPIIANIGNPDAMANTFPDPIRPYKRSNGMFLEDFEVDRNWLTNPRATFAASPLIFPPKRSFEYALKRHTADICTNDALRFTFADEGSIPYSGTYCGLIQTHAAGKLWSVNHGYWSLNSLNNERYWQFYLRICSLTSKYFHFIFAFNGDFSNKCGYAIFINPRVSSPRIELHRWDNNVVTVLQSFGFVAGDTSYDYKLLKITEKAGNIKVYHEALGNIINFNDLIYRNMPYTGLIMPATGLDGIGWIDNFAIG